LIYLRFLLSDLIISANIQYRFSLNFVLSKEVWLHIAKEKNLENLFFFLIKEQTAESHDRFITSFEVELIWTFCMENL